MKDFFWALFINDLVSAGVGLLFTGLGGWLAWKGLKPSSTSRTPQPICEHDRLDATCWERIGTSLSGNDWYQCIPCHAKGVVAIKSVPIKDQ